MTTLTIGRRIDEQQAEADRWLEPKLDELLAQAPAELLTRLNHRLDPVYTGFVETRNRLSRIEDAVDDGS